MTYFYMTIAYLIIMLIIAAIAFFKGNKMLAIALLIAGVVIAATMIGVLAIIDDGFSAKPAPNLGCAYCL